MYFSEECFIYSLSDFHDPASSLVRTGEGLAGTVSDIAWWVEGCGIAVIPTHWRTPRFPLNTPRSRSGGV